MKSWSVLVGTLLLGACASQQPPLSVASAPRTLPKGHPPIARGKLPPNHPPVGPDLDAPGPRAEEWAKPYVLFDGRTGQPISDNDLQIRLKDAKVIYVAEQHTRASHHQVQLEVLHRTAELGSVAVGLEMVQWPFQSALDHYLTTTDEKTMLEGVEWKKRWGFDYRLYRPIFQWAARNQHPLVALNARAELTKAIASGGASNVPTELVGEVPALDDTLPSHRSRLQLVWQQHASHHGKRAFEHFYSAQILWDESMAENLHRYLSTTDSAERMVVLAGSGHVRYAEGIPSRAERRGTRPSLTIVPMDAEDAVNLLGSGIGDILWVFVAEGESSALAETSH
ncbi:MAG: ChaN family lipoprotein [Myxococcales bacterium]|nr:ChaN family lipoprotein [Myxococcales bacterium]